MRSFQILSAGTSIYEKITSKGQGYFFRNTSLTLQQVSVKTWRNADFAKEKEAAEHRTHHLLRSQVALDSHPRREGPPHSSVSLADNTQELPNWTLLSRKRLLPLNLEPRTHKAVELSALHWHQHCTASGAVAHSIADKYSTTRLAMT